MTYPKACWHCRYFDGMTGQNTAALCSRPDACRVRSGPQDGCAEFDRVRDAAPPAGWEPPGTHIDLVRSSPPAP